MSAEHNPASDPMNGPNRLALQRTPEAREYDKKDWPGSSSFHPSHLEKLFREMLERAKEQTEAAPGQPELPFD